MTAWAVAPWTDGTTSDIPEGTQLYFTNARADARAALIVSAHNVAGDSHTDIRTALAGKQDAGSYAGSSTPGGAATSAESCTGNAATATALATARTLTIGSKANTFDGSADKAWTLAEIGAVQTLYTVNMGGDAADWTTADFIAFLAAQGAFNVRQWYARGSWDYGKNRTISDTGVGRLSLAGAVVEVFGVGNASQYIVRILSAPTSNTGGMVNSIFVYSNYGSPFSPGWTRFTKSYELEAVSNALTTESTTRAANDNALWAALYAEQTGGTECIIPLAATGDGSGVLTLRLWSDVANTAKISAGAFYGEIEGTTNLGQSVDMKAGQFTTFYIKLPKSATATLTITYGWALTKWGQSGTECIVEATNAPKLNGFDVKYIPQNVTTIQIYTNLNAGVIAGTTYPWTFATAILFHGSLMTLSGTTYPWTAATFIKFDGSSMTLSGTTYPWTAATYIQFQGNSMAISGTTYPWTAAGAIVFGGGSMTISGATYPWIAAAYITFWGSMTLSADLSTSCLTTRNLSLYLSGTGIAVTYTTTRTWPTTMRQVFLRPSSGSMPTADTDRLFIDIDATCTTPSNEKLLDARGNCGVVTAASETARANLAAKGFAVSYNSNS
jgi:hypothetical protein